MHTVCIVPQLKLLHLKLGARVACRIGIMARGRQFAIAGRTFRLSGETLADACFNGCAFVIEKVVLLLGPILICFATAIISGLAHTFFTIILPMLRSYYEETYPTSISNLLVGGHILWVCYILVIVTFNYFMCVTTRNTGPKYDQVVRELALATNLSYPETPQEIESYKQDYEAKMVLRMQRRRERAAEIREAHTPSSSSSSSSNNNMTNRGQKATTTGATKKAGSRPPPMQPTPKNIRAWMILLPDEWGYCHRTNQPKPPRSHYDHVTKSLVLCLDHYCPWMFNSGECDEESEMNSPYFFSSDLLCHYLLVHNLPACSNTPVGYFNYRYFCSFLWFVQIGMFYGMCVSYLPWMNCGGELYRAQLRNFRKTGKWEHTSPFTPFPSQRMAISLSFMLCLAVGIAVSCLGFFHLYLTLTGQTTIEFHGNYTNKRKAKKLGKPWKNPYDMGIKGNWEQIFGRGNPIRSLIIPSARQPDLLPLPLKGENGLRTKYQQLLLDAAKSSHSELENLV